MRNFSNWLLVLAVLAVVPAVASADGLLGGRQQKAPAGNSAQKQHNQQQAEHVKSALQKAKIDGYGISIEVIEGIVKLNGNVRKPSDLARAGEACQQVPGITRVVNKLKYVPQNKVRSAAATLTDLVRRSGQEPAVQQVNAESTSAPSNQQVAEQIGSSLEQSGLAGQSISILYQNGVVTLSGEVDSATHRNAAAAAASGVPGVITVNNGLVVRQTGFAPKQITSASYAKPFPTVGYSHQPAAANVVQMSAAAATPAAMGGAGVFSHPQLPSHAWPAYAQYPNSAAVTYPTQYSASAFPYIGPFYPYPQVPLGWREARLQWDDGFWHLNFNKSESVWDILFNPSGK